MRKMIETMRALRESIAAHLREMDRERCSVEVRVRTGDAERGTARIRLRRIAWVALETAPEEAAEIARRYIAAHELEPLGARLVWARTRTLFDETTTALREELLLLRSALRQAREHLRAAWCASIAASMARAIAEVQHRTTNSIQTRERALPSRE